jgi:hypothetical protein
VPAAEANVLTERAERYLTSCASTPATWAGARATEHMTTTGSSCPRCATSNSPAPAGASEKFAVELLNLGQPDLAVRRPGVVRGDRATLR